MSSRASLGQWGERQARLHLEAEGYRVTATNFRSRAGELDIIAVDGDELVVVEVKTRRGNSVGQAERQISPSGAERLVVCRRVSSPHSAFPYDSELRGHRSLLCVNLDRQGNLFP